MSAPTLLPVEDGGPGVTVFLEAGPRRALELVQGAVDLSIGRPVLGSPRQDSGAVFPFEGERVGDLGHLVRIPRNTSIAGRSTPAWSWDPRR